jgi:hypothetical protein
VLPTLNSEEAKRCQLTDKLVYIVGPLRLQNDLMALFLKQETGAKCLVGKDLRHIPVADDENIGQPKLVLLDCLRKDKESLLKGVEKYPILAGYKYLLAIKWLVSRILFGFCSRALAR